MNAPQDIYSTYMNELSSVIDQYGEKAKELAKERSTHKHLTALEKKGYVDSVHMSNARAEMEVYASTEWKKRDETVAVLEVEAAALKMRFEIGREWIGIERTREATARMVV